MSVDLPQGSRLDPSEGGAEGGGEGGEGVVGIEEEMKPQTPPPLLSSGRREGGR